MTLDFPSYRNHVVYLSVYGAVLYRLISSLLFETTTSLMQYAVRGTACLLFLWLIKTEIMYLWLRRGLPPGDSGYPLLGDTVSWIHNPATFLRYKFTQHNTGEGTNNSPFFTSSFMFQPSVFFIGDSDVTWYLAQERKGNLVPWLPPHVIKLMGPTSIITSHGTFHRRLRRLMEPAFSPSAVQNFTSIIDSIIADTLSKWCGASTSSSRPNNNNNNHLLGRQSCSDLSMRLLIGCAFPQIDPGLGSEVKHNTQLWLVGMTDFLPNPIGESHYDKGVKARKRLDEILTEIINSFREENDEIQSTATLLGRLCYAKDDDGNPLADQELLDNLLMLILAGHDTIGGSLGNILYRLNKLPVHQKDALRTEASQVGTTSCTSIQNNEDAPLINAFMAEMWRIDPPTGFHGSQPTKTLVYKREAKRRNIKSENKRDDGTVFTFPKGVGLYATMHDSLIDSERYPNANEFRLERFLPRDHPLVTEDTSSFVSNIDYNSLGLRYRSFGIGAHTCLGHRFAKQVCRLFLVRLLPSYHVTVIKSNLETVPSRRWNTTFQLRKVER